MLRPLQAIWQKLCSAWGCMAVAEPNRWRAKFPVVRRIPAKAWTGNEPRSLTHLPNRSLPLTMAPATCCRFAIDFKVGHPTYFGGQDAESFLRREPSAAV